MKSVCKTVYLKRRHLCMINGKIAADRIRNGDDKKKGWNVMTAYKDRSTEELLQLKDSLEAEYKKFRKED